MASIVEGKVRKAQYGCWQHVQEPATELGSLQVVSDPTDDSQIVNSEPCDEDVVAEPAVRR